MRSKNVLYNISSSLLLNVIVFAFGLLVPKIIINYYGSSVNGLVTSITQFLSYITLLETIGPVVKAALYKPIAKKDKKSISNILRASERFFHVILFIILAYLLVLIIIYPYFVSNEFDKIFTISLIIIISINTFAEYYFGITYRLFLQADQKSYVISVIQIVSYIFSFLVIIISSYLGMSIHMLKLLSGLVFVVRPIVQRIYVKRKYDINLKNADNSYKLKQKWDSFAQHVASVVHNSADITILTLFSTLVEVSVYSVYAMIMKGLKSIAQSLNDGIDATFGNLLANEELDNLKNKFGSYEVIYFSLVVVLYGCCLNLILPFVNIYTFGIVDVNYNREMFAYLLVISEFIWAIRQPYNNLVKSKGHFKETMKGAWLESGINIFVSLLLVHRYGLVGVVIGTFLAMLIRSIEFIIHVNKKILFRNIFVSVKKIIVCVFEMVLIGIIYHYIPLLTNNSFINWIINSLIIVCCSSIIVIAIDLILYKKEIKEVIYVFKKIFVRRPTMNSQ